VRIDSGGNTVTDDPRGFGNDWQRWRGGVDVRIGEIEEAMERHLGQVPILATEAAYLRDQVRRVESIADRAVLAAAGAWATVGVLVALVVAHFLVGSK
jgi:hypothetical protein